jgi:hypothetical protein
LSSFPDHFIDEDALMNLRKSVSVLLFACLGAVLAATGCSRLLPARKGTAHSYQLALDTRRFPVIQLAGTFIPGVFPAVTKIPIVFVQKIPAEANFTSAAVEVLSKSGDMQVLEAVIEDNQVYLKFAVPSVDSISQYNVLVRVNYEYKR